MKKDYIKFFARSLYIWLFAIQMLINIAFVLIDVFVFINGFKLWLIILTTIFMLPNLIIIPKFIQFIWAHAMCVHHINEVRERDIRTRASSGPPGAGKTSSEIYEAVIKAEAVNEEMEYEVWLIQSLKDEELPLDILVHKKEILQSYEFYMQNDTVPCLWTNIPVKVNGKFSNRLTKDHLLQKERVPYMSVLFNDEIGNDFEATKKSSTKLKPLSQFARFIRHFFDGFWSFTEQEFSKAFIDVRRTTGSVRYYLSQKWVLKPTLLLKLENFLKNLYLKNIRRAKRYEYGSDNYNYYMNLSKLNSEIHSPFMRKLRRFIKNIGYRKYTYKELGNAETGVNITDDVGRITFYAPSCLNCEYDDRCYQALYKCKDKEIKPFHFNGMKLTEEELKN